jgi:hypothetical protein
VKATAEMVFGWKNVRKHDGYLIGKKQDKAKHWRKAKAFVVRIRMALVVDVAGHIRLCSKLATGTDMGIRNSEC